MEHVGPLCRVEPQRLGDGVQDGWAHPGESAPLDLGVVLDAHPGQRSNLAAPQPRDAAAARVGEPDVAR